MDKNSISPYVRLATYSKIISPFYIKERVIFDYEMIYVSDGMCKITVDGDTYICKENDVVFIRPGVPHKFESVDDNDFEQPHTHFDLVYNDNSYITPVSFKPKSIMSNHERSLIQDDVLSDVNIPCVFVPHDIERFKKLFFELLEIFSKKTYNYEIQCKVKMLEIIEHILRQFEENKSNEQSDKYNCIIMCKNYIDNNFLSVITLDSLSSLFYINKYTLMRRFKKMYHENIMAYYRKLRIEYSKNTLQKTNLSVLAISEKMNFNDIYSFSRFFKNNVGCSPVTYRKNLNEKIEE